MEDGCPKCHAASGEMPSAGCWGICMACAALLRCDDKTGQVREATDLDLSTLSDTDREEALAASKRLARRIRSSCPKCGFFGQPPSPNDWGVCLQCATLLYCGKNGIIREATAQDMARFPPIDRYKATTAVRYVKSQRPS